MRTLATASSSHGCVLGRLGERERELQQPCAKGGHARPTVLRAVTTPIILDCDPGHDDAIALLLALASPEVELIGVTTVYGNQTLEKTTANALRVLELVGRTDVRWRPARSGPLVRELVVAAHVHGESGLDGPACRRRTPEPVSRRRSRRIIEERGRPAEPSRSSPTGPLTNVARYLDEHGS